MSFVFPNLIFMPTGGVDTTRQSIETWFNAGVSAVGMGSKLISDKVVTEKSFSELTTATRNALDIIKNVKKL